MTAFSDGLQAYVEGKPIPVRNADWWYRLRKFTRRHPKFVASSAVGAKGMEELYEKMSPMARNVTHEEVGRVGAFLLSSMSDGITAEIVHVDAGYNAMGSPGRLLDQFKS